ncbi:Sorting nexin-16 [Linum grandiflorum]
MSSEHQHQHRQAIIKDLVEEAKKRIVILAICVVGLSYLMSLTSSSVWVNLPAAAFLLIILRYFSLDIEMKRKTATYVSKPLQPSTTLQDKPHNARIVQKSIWRKKVNSPAVEDAINNFTRHLVSEWVTDLWYGRLTPDKQGPEELVEIINGVLGELSARLRDINLLDLLTRDIINLICSHLILFRASQAKIEKKQPDLLSIEQRDREIKRVLAEENKLHPALFSAEAEHKVLQHLMEGLISFTFRPEDLKCSFFGYLARELLACVVMRPVLNLASPRFLNERIEILVTSKGKRGPASADGTSPSKPNENLRIYDHSPRYLDPTGTGVELVQLKNDASKSRDGTPETDNTNAICISKDPLLSIDTRSTRSWSSLPLNSQVSNVAGGQENPPGEQWGDMLDVISKRKTAALAPENFENMWTKGMNYNRNGGGNGLIEQVRHASSSSKSIAGSKNIFEGQNKDGMTNLDSPLSSNTVKCLGYSQPRVRNPVNLITESRLNSLMHTSYLDDGEQRMMSEDGHISDSSSASPHISEEEAEDAIDITGLHSPGTKVWDGKSNRNMPVAHIHHPLENPQGRGVQKLSKVQTQRLSGRHTGRKRSRSSNPGIHVWQEVERTSFLSGDGQDVLSAKGCTKTDDSTDDSEVESLGRLSSGTAACSSRISVPIAEVHTPSAISAKTMMLDSFYKLKCEVLGANIVKGDSKTFAVYSISVTDVNGNSWSIKRRFRHFEELHRRLKEYPEYSLHLPPKHFLSTGLDMSVIQERCKLLDRYLKKLLQIPRVSGSIEVWDFLSVDSQTYGFSSSFSIVETLSVALGDKPSEISDKSTNISGSTTDTFDKKDRLYTEKSKPKINESTNNVPNYMRKRRGKDLQRPFEDSGSDSDVQSNISQVRNFAESAERSEIRQGATKSFDAAPVDSNIPPEWVPPNLALPLLDLVGVVFQMQEGGWIRRKAFWMAKQVLQLGMGDALDDWLIEKIQLLRKGTVIASGIKRVEQILWPDGIFITKHPSRRPPSTVDTASGSSNKDQAEDFSSPKQTSPNSRQPSVLAAPQSSEEQQRDAERRAKFVYELMIDNAPSTIVGLVGRKEYEQCVKDVYFFIQSPVCLKQLAYDLIELLLLSTFPEMDYVLRELHEEKSKFGELKAQD